MLMLKPLLSKIKNANTKFLKQSYYTFPAKEILVIKKGENQSTLLATYSYHKLQCMICCVKQPVFCTQARKITKPFLAFGKWVRGFLLFVDKRTCSLLQQIIHRSCFTLLNLIQFGLLLTVTLRSCPSSLEPADQSQQAHNHPQHADPEYLQNE